MKEIQSPDHQYVILPTPGFHDAEKLKYWPNFEFYA